MASLCALSELAGHWEEPPQAAGFLSSSQRGTVDLPCTPGPAYYGRREPAYRVALGDASFRSGLSRLEGLKTTAEGPGPGSYDTPRPQRRSLPLRSAARTRSLRERTHRQEETALAAADLCACGRKAGQGHGAITASLAVPKSPGKHVVPPKRMKSLLGNETVAFRDKADEVFMWIGSNSQEVPSPRRRFPGKVSGRTSAFASGTERQTSPRERQGTPSPGDYATVGFAEKLASRLCGPGSKVPFDSSQDSGRGLRGSQHIARKSASPGPGSYESNLQNSTSIRSPSPEFYRAKRFGDRVSCSTPGPGDYEEAAHSAWLDEVATQAPLSVGSTPPPFGSRQERFCAISTTPDAPREVEVIPPDPLRRLDVMTRRALRRAYEGVVRRGSPSPCDYDPVMPWELPMWRMQPYDEVFGSTESRWQRKSAPSSPSPGPGFYSPAPSSPTPKVHDFGLPVARFLDSPCEMIREEASDDAPDFLVEGASPRRRLRDVLRHL
ncbi:unnamed protein product [Symbiodinium necroappetens]|uniref:Uncharacterized protein n=1 Tax=Symbiodinium necroappetens TaxID=1628268 RepID=A0A812S6D6_9DINO|nr:unnamed protein product [Symbiodinium necroappetens]